MKKIISLILVIVLATFCFVSCGETSVTPEPEETELDLAKYKVIVSDKQTSTEQAYCDDFFSKFREKTGLNLEFTDDLLNESLGLTETEREILIGNTNRKESTIEATETENSYEIKYVNKKIVIIAENAYALEEALNKFLSDFVKSGSTVIDVPSLKAQAKSAYYKELEKITLTAYGDSYFNYSKDKEDPGYRWIDLLDAKYDMNLINKGIGGSTISNVDGHNPMVNRLNSLPPKTDIILFEGGRNDRTAGVPLGDDLDSRDVNTFAGSINYVLDFLQEKYPNALIICITAWKVDDPSASNDLLATTEYANKMVEVCAHRGVVCFDATKIKVSGVVFDMNSKYFREKYCWSDSDVSHLNHEGMKLVFPAFEKFIGEEYAKFLSSK